MRTWLLVFMIALLPLRGWVGDAMALAAWPAMAEEVVSAVAQPPCHGVAEAHHDEARATANAHSPGHVHSGHSGDHTGCNSCDICHGTVFCVPAAFAGEPQPPAARPTPSPARFASAVLPGQHKPPIA